MLCIALDRQRVNGKYCSACSDTYTEVRAIVRVNGRVTQWLLWPAINLTALADTQLRGSSQLVLGRPRLMLYNARRTIRFILTRPITDVDVPPLADSLAVVYADQTPADGYPRQFQCYFSF